MIIQEYGYVDLVYSGKESEAVKMALVNLRRDLMRTLQCQVDIETNLPKQRILVGTVGCLEELDDKADLKRLKAEDGSWRREAFLIQEKEGELLIAGTDRRGTIYGIYDFCQWLGVSPWYFFADVPVRRRREAVIPEGWCKADYPSVEYRGIFINDEEELEHWVWRYMGEETIGVKTYEKIFELLLRLKLNYIWPAMHVNSFNVKRENGALADRMGIVVGTSHCDMLMRSNNREWKPWLAKKGYTGVEYDFSIPGRNREILKEYWRESVEQNRDFEVSYTVGMRGIHDSGFETRSLKGLMGEALLRGKIELLESVMAAQKEILSETLDREPVKIFVPYKEVLELYDNGLEVPEDLTLIWTNDNYGYIRRYPGEKEKARKGGNGIYYHNSYWAPPGASYLFICSIPMAQTRNELLKAYEEGITKVWVTNFGAIKPLEQQLSFYAKLAWEADGRRERDLEIFDEEIFLRNWIDSMFSGGIGTQLAPLLLQFDQITNVRKLEHMDDDCFSQVNYGDEAAARLHAYEMLCEEIGEIYDNLKKEEKDAFFQLVLMKVQAAYFTNGMYYYADRSRLCIRQGKNSAAALYTERSQAFDLARRKLLQYYNRVMSNGKWDGILTPEDFPPPRTAMYPACQPPLFSAPDEMIVTCWNGQDELIFTDGTDKWIELANGGDSSLPYRISVPDWLWVEAFEGTVKEETRILLHVQEETDPKKQERGERKGVLTVFCGSEEVRRIPVTDGTGPVREALAGLAGKVPVEDSGRVVIEAAAGRAEAGEASDEDWRVIRHLGRYQGALLEGRNTGAVWSCPFFLTQASSFVLELHRFPSLCSVGRLRVGVSADGGTMQVLESASTDEHRGTWKTNILNHVDKLICELGYLEAGLHTLTFTVIDRYVSFTRAVLYAQDCPAGRETRRRDQLGCSGGDQHLPKHPDLDAFTSHFYGDIVPDPRPVLYLPVCGHGDSLTMDDLMRLPEDNRPVTPQQLLAQAQTPAEERQGVIDIEAVAALADGPAARKSGPAVPEGENPVTGWQYCDSPSHGGTGLAMYLPEEGLSWSDPAEAPALHFTIRAKGGHYTLWLYTWQWGTDSARFTIGIDGKIIPEEQLYGGNPVWRYSSEHVWKWIPAWETDLEPGLHQLTVYSLNSRLRIGRISLRRQGLPE